MISPMDQTQGENLSGTYPDPTVAALQGQAVGPAQPTNGQVLKYNGSNNRWEPGTDETGGGSGNYTAGSGINISGNVISNTAPDQPITLTGTGATSVAGSYPNFTISSTDNNTTYTGGTGITITGRKRNQQ